MLTNKDKSSFILVKLGHKGRLRLTIPVALNAIDEIIEAFQELIEVVEVFIPKVNREKLKYQISTQSLVNKDITIGGIITLLQEAFNELRRYRGLRLVEVEAREFYVKIEFN